VALRELPVDPLRLKVASPLFDSEVRRSNDHALITLVGELDTSTAGTLYELLAQLAAEGVRHIALNLAQLTFIDSTGISVVVTEHKRAESMGGELIILSACPRVRRVFELTGLGDYLNLRPVAVITPHVSPATSVGTVKHVSVSPDVIDTGPGR
jgi:anti-sigma B factor antagonist